MPNLTTEIAFPPGKLSDSVVGDVFQKCIGVYGWVKPLRYGDVETPHKFSASQPWHETLLELFHKKRRACVADKNTQLYLSVGRNEQEAYLGSLSWFTSESFAQDAQWRESHASQVGDIMKLVGSPWAFADTRDNIERKTQRWVREGQFERREYLVRDYSEGLPGIFWRNFFGPAYSGMFGDRLQRLPNEYATKLSDNIWLVQPYKLPLDAQRPESMASESRIIEELGKASFYDHSTGQKPTRSPYTNSKD